MKWYDTFSTFYDIAIEPFYTTARKKGVEALGLSEGDVVLDLACGTGPNFKYISPLVGEKGLVIGLDYSQGMLDKAAKKIAKYNIENIVLIQEDARKINIEQINKSCGRKIQLNKIICILGLSVIPNWEEVFENTFNLLEPGGKYIIIDVHADRFVLQSSLVELVARADLKRKSWEPLKRSCSDFSLDYISTKRYLHGGLLFLAAGIK